VPEPLREASLNQLRSARRLLRRKERTANGSFLVEGPQAVREALGRPGLVDTVFVGRSMVERHSALVDSAVASGAETVLAGDTDLDRLSDAVTPQGIVAISASVHVELTAALAGAPRLVVCCAQVRDPGNAGTVIRCADAFGADAVVLTEGSVDAYNPKTVRASAGSLFHLPLALGSTVAEVVGACRDRGLQVLAADGSGGVDLDDLTTSGDLSRPTAWLFGNEAWGLPEQHRRLADQVVRVPMYGGAESLNLSTAAAVCLYATASVQRSARAQRIPGAASPTSNSVAPPD